MGALYDGFRESLDDIEVGYLLDETNDPEQADPLDEFINKPDLPQCPHLHPLAIDLQIACGDCGEVLINLDGERAAQEDERRV